MNDDQNETLPDDENKEVQNTEQTGDDASDREEANSQDAISYSWVNPKVQNREETEQDRNWSGRTFTEDYTDASAGMNFGNGTGTGTEPGQKNGAGNYTGYRQDYGNGSPAYGRQTQQAAGNKKKPVSTGKKWALLVVMALVFGLIAGLVSFGVEKATGTLSGSARQTDASEEDDNSGNNGQEQSGTAEVQSASDEGTDNGSTQAGQGSASESSMTVQEVAAKTLPSVVTISTVSVQEMEDIFGGVQDYQVEGAGSGVIIGENDTEMLIATNAHVVEGAQELSVGFNDETAVSGSIKGNDTASDLAIVAVSLDDIPEETMGEISVIELGDSDQLVLGEQVVAMGNALGLGTSVTSGYVSALDRTVEFSEGGESEDLIQTDAAINSGNSGGALVNMNGQLIGINEGRASSVGEVTVDNVGYSIPISKAKPILEKMMNFETREKNDEDEQGYLGITCANVNSEAAEQYNVPVGVYVRSVTEGAAADNAGIKAGDVITELDGRSVTTYEDLTDVLAYYKSGETVDLVIMRSKNGEYEEQTVSVTLSTREEAQIQ